MRPIWNASQPSPTSSAPPRLGLDGIAPLGAAQDVEALALEVHAAAGAVHEGHDAVDSRIVVEDARAVDSSAMNLATVAEQFTLVRMPR